MVDQVCEGQEDGQGVSDALLTDPAPADQLTFLSLSVAANSGDDDTHGTL